MREGLPLTLLLRGQREWTALMAAAYNGATEAVKALIEAGAEKDLQNKASLLLPPSLPPSTPSRDRDRDRDLTETERGREGGMESEGGRFTSPIPVATSSPHLNGGLDR